MRAAPVSILVLVDVALELARVVCSSIPHIAVSILVLVDVALEPRASRAMGRAGQVSILVLVDVALEPFTVISCSFPLLFGFNPCSRGCCS